MIRITAPHFCAGVVLRDGRVTRAAPIVGYMMGWPRERIERYCAGKRAHRHCRTLRHCLLWYFDNEYTKLDFVDLDLENASPERTAENRG